MRKDVEKVFLPTQPAKLRRGEPATKDDIFMWYINQFDRGIEGIVRPVLKYRPELMEKVIEANKNKNAVKRNWFSANVHRMAL